MKCIKKYSFCVALLFMIVDGQLYGQKILLKISGITAAAGEEVKAVDFKMEGSSTWSSNGITPGIIKVYPLLIKKTVGLSSHELYKKTLTGAVFTPNVILEYYDAANVMYFSISLVNALVTNFYWLSPECPTCIQMEHQVAFNPRRIETFDVPTGITVRYDYQTKAFY
ncbi:MAG: hypothetical protein ABIY51_04565 [Ferruginibacter sp.]